MLSCYQQRCCRLVDGICCTLLTWLRRATYSVADCSVDVTAELECDLANPHMSQLSEEPWDLFRMSWFCCAPALFVPSQRVALSH